MSPAAAAAAAAASDGAAPAPLELQVTQSAAAVRCLLRFIYTGGELDEAVLATDLPDVLQLASQHGLTGLKKACELHLLQQLCVKRVVPALIAADQSDLTLLKAACFAISPLRLPLCLLHRGQGRQQVLELVRVVRVVRVRCVSFLLRLRLSTLPAVLVARVVVAVQARHSRSVEHPHAGAGTALAARAGFPRLAGVLVELRLQHRVARKPPL